MDNGGSLTHIERAITQRLATNFRPNRSNGFPKSFEPSAALGATTHSQMLSYEDFSIRVAPAPSLRDGHTTGEIYHER